MALVSIKQSSKHKIVRNLFTLFLMAYSFSALALQPTSQQVNAFKSMSPSKQAQLAQQFGVSLPNQTQQNTTKAAENVDTVEARTTDQSDTEESEITESGDKLGNKQNQGLKPFGYDLFAGKPTTFTPVTDIPVSSDYILGAGDSLKVNLYGKESLSYELEIDQEGMVYLPDLGPLSLAGFSFSEAKQQLFKTIDQKMIGIKASVSMGRLRSIRVFILGEAHQPGSYVVSSLSTITNALVLSGGVSTRGSLRNVQLKRRGKLIQTLDLYDLLLQGDTSKDAQLKSGDVVFIPPIGLTVGIRGEVRRPAIYEIKQDTNAEQLINLAGGMLSTAHPKLSKVQRLSRDDQKLLLDVDLAQAGSNFKLKNGDDVYIPASLEILNNVVTVSGEVLRPGMQHWQPGVRISDMINAAGLRPNADLNYALIKRYLPPSGKLQIQSFSLSELLSEPGSEKDLMLLDQDELILFDLYQSGRKAVIATLVDELRVHTGIHSASQEVVVSGNVRYPGTYPLVEGMQIEDLINAAGGLTEKAFQLRAELSRTEFNEQQERYQYRVDLNLSAADSLSFALKSRDELQVKTIPDWAESEQVVLTGEVKFPGTYPIYRDDTLASLLERAGGVTELAYTPGAIFTRTDLQEQQAEQLKAMQERLAEDIAKAELVDTNQGGGKKDAAGVAEAQKLLSQLKSTSAKGRLVIDLDKVLENDLNYSIPLQEGDNLYVPGKKNSVTIIGEVQLPISQIYESQLDYWDYIERSGGTTDKADEDRVYIIKANGGVHIPDSSSWFTGSQQQVSPGDTIVVPLDADKLDQIVLWRDVSQIFYQIALGAATVSSF